MSRNRLEAFTDGVLAIVITIMVLEMKVPHGHGFRDVARMVPTFVSYVMSFMVVAIYWNNHHHLMHVLERVGGQVMWANMNLLFWLSQVPFVAGWMGESHFSPLPVAAYGVVMLACALSYYALACVILSCRGRRSRAATVIGKDFKDKMTVALYAGAVPVAFWNRWIACGVYVFVAMVWFVPDRRVERALARGE